jgi:hypothetical protein
LRTRGHPAFVFALSPYLEPSTSGAFRVRCAVTTGKSLSSWSRRSAIFPPKTGGQALRLRRTRGPDEAGTGRAQKGPCRRLNTGDGARKPLSSVTTARSAPARRTRTSIAPSPRWRERRTRTRHGGGPRSSIAIASSSPWRCSSARPRRCTRSTGTSTSRHTERRSSWPTPTSSRGTGRVATNRERLSPSPRHARPACDTRRSLRPDRYVNRRASRDTFKAHRPAARATRRLERLSGARRAGHQRRLGPTISTREKP